MILQQLFIFLSLCLTCTALPCFVDTDCDVNYTVFPWRTQERWTTTEQRQIGILKKWRKDGNKEHWSCEVTVDSSYHKLYPFLCPIQLQKMSPKRKDESPMFTYFSGQLGHSVGSLVLLHWTHHVILHLCDLKSEGTKMKWRHHSTKSWLYLQSAARCTRSVLSGRHLVDTVDTTACRKLTHREICNQYFVLFISLSGCF